MQYSMKEILQFSQVLLVLPADSTKWGFYCVPNVLKD